MTEYIEYASAVRDIALVIGVPAFIGIAYKLLKERDVNRTSEIQILKSQISSLESMKYDSALSQLDAQKTLHTREKETLIERITKLEEESRSNDKRPKIYRSNIDKSFESSVHELIKETVNLIATDFSELKQEVVVASLMLPTTEDAFETVMYSSNVPAKRSSAHSLLLSTSHGVVGEVFNKNRGVIWSIEENNFIALRSDYEQFYKSGVSAPISVNGRAYGILNLDSSVKKTFTELDIDRLSRYTRLLNLVFESGEIRW